MASTLESCIMAVQRPRWPLHEDVVLHDGDQTLSSRKNVQRRLDKIELIQNIQHLQPARINEKLCLLTQTATGCFLIPMHYPGSDLLNLASLSKDTTKLIKAGLTPNVQMHALNSIHIGAATRQEIDSATSVRDNFRQLILDDEASEYYESSSYSSEVVSRTLCSESSQSEASGRLSVASSALDRFLAAGKRKPSSCDALASFENMDSSALSSLRAVLGGHPWLSEGENSIPLEQIGFGAIQLVRETVRWLDIESDAADSRNHDNRNIVEIWREYLHIPRSQAHIYARDGLFLDFASLARRAHPHAILVSAKRLEELDAMIEESWAEIQYTTEDGAEKKVGGDTSRSESIPVSEAADYAIRRSRGILLHDSWPYGEGDGMILMSSGSHFDSCEAHYKLLSHLYKRKHALTQEFGSFFSDELEFILTSCNFEEEPELMLGGGSGVEKSIVLRKIEQVLEVRNRNKAKVAVAELWSGGCTAILVKFPRPSGQLMERELDVMKWNDSGCIIKWWRMRYPGIPLLLAKKDVDAAFNRLFTRSLLSGSGARSCVRLRWRSHKTPTITQQ